jgi:hypothetical protein
MNIGSRARRFCGLALGVSMLGIGGAQAQSSVVELRVTADGNTVQCPGQNARFIIGAPPLFAWQCVGSASAFRCRLSGLGSYAPDTKIVTVACVGLSEDPPGAGLDLLFASGYEAP